MHIRTRKLIGTVALLVLVIVWALLAMGFAQMFPLSRNHLIEIAYYIVAGLGWVLPAMPLISWMSRPDPETPQADDG
jgi:predicted membrane channel-forming protein YqfA (hemolysin III family)